MRLIVFSSLFFTCIFLVTFAFAEGDDAVYVLDENVSVETSNGVVMLYSGMLIGGAPKSYIWLVRNYTLNTTVGPTHFFNQTVIDCEVPPGYPNPCTPYS